jgi:hypothetical protein
MQRVQKWLGFLVEQESVEHWKLAQLETSCQVVAQLLMLQPA